MEAENQKESLLEQLRKDIRPEHKVLGNVANKISEAVDTLSKQYSKAREANSLQDLLGKTKNIRVDAYEQLFRDGSGEIWSSCSDNLQNFQKKVFSQVFYSTSKPDFLTNQSKNLDSFSQELLQKLLQNNIESDKISSWTQSKIKRTKIIYDMIIKQVKSVHFTDEQKEQEIQKLMAQIKKRAISNHLNGEDLKQCMIFLSALIWKKTQLDLFYSWIRKYFQFVKDNYGFQQKYPEFFKEFNLTEQCFDQRGYHKFPKSKTSEIKFRGKLPYVQPIQGERYGINLGYNDKTDDWLSKDDRVGEWSVAFYPLSKPQAKTASGETTLEAIISRRNSSSMLDTEQSHPYENKVALNKQCQKVGKGICCYPLFSSAISNTKTVSFGNESYRLILQCRVRPEAVKCTENDQVWVINKPEDIKPYGIILFNYDQVKKIQEKDQILTFYKIPNKLRSWRVSQKEYENEMLSSEKKKQVQKKQKQPENVPLTKLIEIKENAKNILNLKINSSKPNEKLRTEGMKAFSKIQLPNATNINIENQDIRDDGIQALCSNLSFQKLEQIELNDNKISVEGVAHLVNNKWSKQVTYKLDTVKTKDNGYAFKVGQGIKSIKKILDESNAQINYEEISKIESSDKPKLFHTLDLLMKTPLEGKYKDLVSQSQELQNNYKEVHQKNVKSQTKSLESVMMTLKEALGQNAEVLLSKKSSARSQVTCNLALCGLGQNRIKFKHRIPDGRWKFEDLEDNNTNLVNFQEWYKEHLAAEYGAKKEDIILHRVNKGSVWTCVSVNPDNFLLKNSNFSGTQKISVIPFFESFNLSPEDFASKGNFTFPESNQTQLHYRAGIPYYQPVHAIRFGFNISKKYDAGTDDWISMDGIPGEWAVAFHGVSSIGNIVPSNNMTVFQSIMSGLQKGQMLRAGSGQAYSSSITTNSGQRVGDGIYCSPRFTTCLLGYTAECVRNNLGFRVILQCRIKPEALKCTNQDDYWVINESKNIRPYGVILVTQQQYDTISRLYSNPGFYSKSCHYSAWKDEYKQFRQKHGLSLW